ncbi:MAG TPA: GMC family oxidoreductase N-terminal domain-containing protein [Candidatus Limnocylindrales bacterium]|nr:GMC family oxidoreductase N-terminal domain-containing protein [Candidatus Limnocylindrales bacterium]
MLDRSLDHSFDLVVIGGGSAGCVVAARASEDPARRVLLVEAGPDPRPLPDVIADPRRQDEVIRDPEWVRHYPVARPDGSTWRLVSGRVMGGGSAVNNLSILRPVARDFDAWQAFGGPDWSYDSLLPLMRAVEDDPDFGDQPHHGRGGPIRLRRDWRPTDRSSPPVAALLDAAAALGLQPCDDLNVPEPFGVCASPYNVVDGRRQTVATAYLDPARDRPNLTILPDTTAIRLRIDGHRVLGVALRTPDGPQTVRAERVVVSAGAYQTPHLLLLSGIGPPQVIEAVGLRVVHPLEGVGENFQDHAVVDLAFAAGPELRPEHRVPKIRVIARSDPSLTGGDLHLMLRPPSSDGPHPVSVRLLDHRARGRLWLASADPDELPCVDPALVRDPGDVAALVAGIELVGRLVSRPPLVPYWGPRVLPAPGADVTAHARSTFISYNHATGTCRFGPAGDPGAVVDPGLRVHGLDNLWIADASVLPVIPHATTNLAAILVGEVAAAALVKV